MVSFDNSKLVVGQTRIIFHFNEVYIFKVLKLVLCGKDPLEFRVYVPGIVTDRKIFDLAGLNLCP
jgi:hypothetical protein